ncbi:MAG: DUF2231 domain-containing protein [Gemmatimonadota bacterium]
MPWHPLVVHFAVALLPASAVTDLAALLFRRPPWHRVAFALLVAGALGAVAAVLTGNAAAAPHRESETVAALVAHHENLGTLSLFAFLTICLGRLPLELQARRGGWPLRAWIGAAVAANALLWLAGHAGAELVYGHGLGWPAGP